MKFQVAPKQWWIVLAIGAGVCAIHPEIFISLLAVVIGIVGMVAILAVFPGCLLIPFIPFWLKARADKKKMQEMADRIKQLEGN